MLRPALVLSALVAGACAHPDDIAFDGDLDAANDDANGDDNAIDEDDANGGLLTALSVVAPAGRVAVGQVDAGLAGRTVIAGGFMVSCGIGLVSPAVAATVSSDGTVAFAVSEAEHPNMVAAVVDVDDNGAFDEGVDVVLVSGGYDLVVDDQGRVALSADAGIYGGIAAGLLLAAVAPVVE